MKINNMKSGDDPPQKGGTGGLESRSTRDPSVGGGLPVLKASGDSTSIDDLVCSAMVLAGAVGCVVG